MRAALIAALLALPAAPLAAEDGAPQIEEGVDLLDRGLRLLAEGLLREAAPALDALEQLNRLVGDLENYEAPEMLPNGDIIIRRKVPLPPEGDTEL